MKKALTVLLLHAWCIVSHAQRVDTSGNILAPTPPMGWMTWNYFADNIHEKDIREMADALVASGMRELGYEYIFIDDGWQGGRDNRNNIVADPQKFPSGMKALADYVHSLGLKLGIYSDAAQLTCAGYTGSLHFERQDAHSFAAWGIDYLKYDYCGAPADSATAKIRYKAMADALSESGRNIALGICEWGDRQPWRWAAAAGGQLWRTTADVRDKWKSIKPFSAPSALHGLGAGILDIVDLTAPLHAYAGPGKWNDMDMILAGLYGKKGPSGDLGGMGCTETEYQSQMSLWCMFSAPLATSNDLRQMDDATKRILLNPEIIALDQDPLGVPAERKVHTDTWDIFLKPLATGEVALAILNRSDVPQTMRLDFAELGLSGAYFIRDVWAHKDLGSSNTWTDVVAAHETKVFRLVRRP